MTDPDELPMSQTMYAIVSGYSEDEITQILGVTADAEHAARLEAQAHAAGVNVWIEPIPLIATSFTVVHEMYRGWGTWERRPRSESEADDHVRLVPAESEQPIAELRYADVDRARDGIGVQVNGFGTDREAVARLVNETFETMELPDA